MRIPRRRRLPAAGGRLRRRLAPEESACSSRARQSSRAELLEDLVERDRHFPRGIVAAQPRQVADVADVIADPRLLEVLPLELLAVEILEPLDRLDHRHAVLPAAAEVV